MSIRALVKNNESIFSLKGVFLLSVALLIFFPPLYRGLFFEREFLVFQMAVLITFILWLLTNAKKKEYMLFRYRFEYALAAFVALYFIVVPFAFSQRSALLEAFRYTGYFATYIIVRDIVHKDRKAVKAVINIILFTIAFVSIVGLLNYFGVLDMKGAVADKRLNSTLQYPNSLAAVLGAAILLSIYNLIKAGKWQRVFYASVACINTVAFILTYSRAMWLILPFVFLIMLFFTNVKYRMYYIFASFAVYIPSAIVSGPVSSYLGTKSVVPWALILGSAVLSNILIQLMDRLGSVKMMLTNKRLCLAVALLMLLAAGTGAVMTSFTEPLVLANNSEENVSLTKSISLYGLEGAGEYSLVLDAETDRPEEGNVWAGRVAFAGIDKSGSSSILKNYYINEIIDGEVVIPFATTESTYYTNISFTNYYSNTSFIINKASIIDNDTGNVVQKLKLNYKFIPENMVKRISSINLKERSLQGRLAFFKDALRIVKDNPIIGIGGGGWESVYPVYRFYDYWTTETHSYPLQVWIETGTLGLASAFVFIIMLFFNMKKMLVSLGDDHTTAMGVLAFVSTILMHSLIDFDLSLGAVAILLWAGFALMTFGFEADARLNKGKGCQKAIPGFIALIVLINSILIYSAMVAAVEAERAYARKDFNAAYKYQQKAVQYDLFNSSYRLNLINTVVSNPDISDEEKHEKIVEQLEKAIKYDTYNWRLYMEKARYLYSVGRFGEAIKYADEAIKYQPSIIAPYIFRQEVLYKTVPYYLNKEDFGTMEIVLKSMMATPKMIMEKNGELVKPIEVSSEFYDYVYKANFLLDNLKAKNIYNISKDVVMYENFFYDTDGNNLPDLWQIPYQDDKIIVGRMAKDDGVEVFAIASDSPSFYTQRINLSLEPSSEYLVAIDGYSRSPGGKMMVIVGSSSGTSQQFRDGYLAFNGQSGIYQTTFNTTDDITPGSQYIRLYFSDIKDEVILRRIIIMKMK